MSTVVDALSPTAPNLMTKNGMRGTTGNNPTFFRTSQDGNTRCWLAVDSETGTLDIRDEDEQTLLEINGKTKKAVLAGLDLGRGIADAQAGADRAILGVDQAKEQIVAVDEKARTAQVSADLALEEIAGLTAGLKSLIAGEINKALTGQVNPVIESLRKVITNLRYDRETEPEATRVALPDLIASHNSDKE